MGNRAWAYAPDYAIRPGVTVQETIDTLGISQAELAERTGRPKKTINEIIKGKAAITPDTALQFEKVLGVPSTFWNNLERNYQQKVAEIREQERLAQWTEWAKQFPAAAMARLGWIEVSRDPVHLLERLLAFFGVASPDSWATVWSKKVAAFRRSTSYAFDQFALAAWLRQGELKARELACEPYDASSFRQALARIRDLTRGPTTVFERQMKLLCAGSGVAVVFVPELPKMHTYGVTRWVNKDAIVQLSLRYKTDDQFWFTFFHEAAHILLHGKRDVFIEGGQPQGEKEGEANRFAADLLIPPEELSRFLDAGSYTRAAVVRFAREIGVAPGVVVGRLQHDGHLEFSQLNSLKRRLEFVRTN